MAISIKDVVGGRDGQVCKHCGSLQNLECVRIRLKSEGGGNKASNRMLLCTKCQARRIKSMSVERVSRELCRRHPVAGARAKEVQAANGTVFGSHASPQVSNIAGMNVPIRENKYTGSANYQELQSKGNGWWHGGE